MADHYRSLWIKPINRDRKENFYKKVKRLDVELPKIQILSSSPKLIISRKTFRSFTPINFKQPPSFIIFPESFSSNAKPKRKKIITKNSFFEISFPE